MAKKYTIPFKSLSGKTCRIDIYDPSYNGTAVTTLTGAPQPITFDEDDSEDLLTVVRCKTGYLNLIETTTGELDGVWPTTNTSRPVKAYYDNQLIFSGFLQAQSFQNKWTAAPREMSIPIISPLGLIDDIDMPTYNPPTMKALNVMLADVVDALNAKDADFNTVVWPKMSVTIDNTVQSLAACPFNSDHEPNPVVPTSLFAPKKMGWFIESLCNAFGWMVHETPTTLVFSKFDHTDKYIACQVANLRTLTGAAELAWEGDTEQALTDYATPADGDGEESTIMPKESIELSYDGEYVKSTNFEFKHLDYYTWDSYNQYKVAWLVSNTPELTGARLRNTNLFDNNGKLISEGANASVIGSNVDQMECILVNLPNSTVITTEIFTLKFYERPTSGDFILSFDLRWGDTLYQIMSDSGNDINVPHKQLEVFVKCGDKYYYGGGEWSTTAPAGGYTSSDDNFGWKITNTPSGFPIEVKFTEYGLPVISEARKQTIAVSDITLRALNTKFDDFITPQSDTDTIKVGSGYGQGSATVGMGLTCYRNNNSLIGSTVITAANRFTDYTYLLYSQQRLRIKFKRLYMMTYWWYIVYAKFMNKNWRVISISENPYDDQYEIILQRSLNA